MSEVSGQHRAINDDYQLDLAITEVRNMPMPFILKVTKPVSRKTTQQIRYAHSLCNALAAYKQASPESAKRDAKVEFGTVTICTSLVTGDRAVRLKSFADYSRDEMIAFVTPMEAYLDENSIPFIRAREK